MAVDAEKQFEALIDSYMEFAQPLGLTRENVRDMLLYAARTRGDKFPCVNCVLSRAHRALNQKYLEKEGRLSIYSRSCVFGIFFRGRECAMQVKIYRQQAEQNASNQKR